MQTTLTNFAKAAALVSVFTLVAAITPAAAADNNGPADATVVTAVAPIAAATMVAGIAPTVRPVFGAPAIDRPAPVRLAAIAPLTISAADLSEPKRPSALMPLYASFVVLQIMDVHSTLKGLNAGATEGNGLVQGVAGSPAKFLLVKAGAAAATIYMTEHIAKRNRVAAVLLMVGLNSVYATIAANNYQLASR